MIKRAAIRNGIVKAGAFSDGFGWSCMDHPPQLSGVGAETNSNKGHKWTNLAAKRRID